MERVFGAQHPDNGLSWLALAAVWQGRTTQAEGLFKRAEALVQRSRSLDDFPLYLTFRSYLERRLGHGEAGLASAKQSLDRRREIAQQAAGRGSRGGASGAITAGYARAIVHSALGLARAYIGLGRFKEAIGASEQSVQNFAQGFGESHPLVGWAYVEQANAYLGIGDLVHAGEADAKALKNHESLYGESVAVFQDAVLSGRIAMQAKRPAEALEHFRDAIRSAEASSVIELRPTIWLSDYMDLLGAGGPADAFDAAQLVRGGVTDEAIRAMATRAASDQPEIAAVVRALQDAHAHAVDLRARLGEEQRKAPEERDASEGPRLQAELSQAEATAATSEQRLQAQFPRYARLVQPSRVPADAVNRLLRRCSLRFRRRHRPICSCYAAARPTWSRRRSRWLS